MVDFVVIGCILGSIVFMFMLFSLVDDVIDNIVSDENRTYIRVNGYNSIRYRMMKSIDAETLYLIKDFDVFFNEEVV